MEIRNKATKAIFCLLALSFLSCNKKDNNTKVFSPNERIKPVLDSFVKSDYCKSCIHELYIDKISPHYYQLTLYKGNSSLTNEENLYNKQFSLGETYSDDIKIYIFSGIEHYFGDDYSKNKKIDSVSIKNIKNESLIWVVKDSFNSITIKKEIDCYPFMPLPTPVWAKPSSQP